MDTTKVTTIHPEMRDPFRQFSRNGRWGTCVECPRDADGNAYPEFCISTERYDHRLTIEQLAEQYQRHLT